MDLFNPFTRLFGVEYQSYTLWLMLSVLLASVLCIWSLPRKLARVDALLLGLALGVALGRMVHVGLQWDYFKDNLSEISRLGAGGLDGRGALMGGLFGVWLGARWRGIDWMTWQGRLAWAAVLLGVGAWGACWGARCAYGAEVANMADYPALMTWEAEDIYGIGAPRFAVQPLALMATIGVGLALALVTWREWARTERLAWVLASLCAIAFSVGFLRGDIARSWANIRLDQWLDLALCAGALGVIGYGRWRKRMIAMKVIR
jgi:hypothetical protein